MRKYFLLSAVALMAATNVNAATEYADATLEAKVSIIRHTKLSCTALNFGTIAVPENNGESSIEIDPKLEISSSTGDIYELGGAEAAKCEGVDFNGAELLVEEVTTLTNKKNELELSVDYITGGGVLTIGGTLVIPANVALGDYTGSIEVTIIR